MARLRTTERTRADIVGAAARLLREQGVAALTTRGVADAADAQAPTIYRLFGDKDGLINAVAEHVMATYVAANADRAREAVSDGDPVGDLRTGWKMHVEFGLANPDLYELLNAPGRRERSPATAAGVDVLRARVHRLATAGLLRVDEDRAVAMIHAAGSGVVLTLLQAPSDSRDLDLPDVMFDGVMNAILAEPADAAGSRVSTAVVTFRAILAEIPALSRAERALMAEWLTRSVAHLQAQADHR